MVRVQDYLRTGKHGKAVATVRASRYCVYFFFQFIVVIYKKRTVNIISHS